MKETLSAQLLDHLVENSGEYKTLIRDLPDEMVKARELYDPEKE
jgi:hypothetical protein